MKPIERYQLFFLQADKGKEDGRIRYRIRWGKEQADFSVGYRVHPDKWSTDTERCKNNTTHGKDKTPASEINRAIQRMEDHINSIFYRYELEGKIPTAVELREEYNILIGIRKPVESDSIQDVFKEFIEIESIKNSWSKETLKKVNVIRNHLRRFKSDLTVSDITEESLQGFIHYLSYNRKLRNTTVEKHYSFLLWFIRWAVNRDIIDTKAHLTFKPRFKGTDTKEVIYLTWDELMHLYSFDFKDLNYLDRVRDVFCFCCFTGLRYSDARRLSKSDIHKDYISIVTQKTTDRLKIELNNYSATILDKYKDIESPNNSALPVISNQNMNKYLKIMGEKAGINERITEVYFIGNKRIEETSFKYELLSTHCGRRTFVVNALSLGIPSEVIMRWTGHSDHKAMKPYVAIVDDLKRSEMDKFNI